MEINEGFEGHYRVQVETLARFLLKEEKNRVREGESAVECAMRLIRTRRPKIRGRSKLRIFGFSKILAGMQRLEQDYATELCLEVLPDGSGRIMEWDSGKELFWFDTVHQLYRRLNLRVPREEMFDDSGSTS